MTRKKIINKINFHTENIKNIKQICDRECNIRKKTLYKIIIPEIANIILDFLKNDICCKHQYELYEQNLLLDIYNKRLNL